jgi:pyruvate formate lyase activating enzyme
MRCDFCYNADIVFAKSGKYSFNDALEFLKTRVGLLEAVVLSGGEASLQELTLFSHKIKELGFKIKLDTNGTNPTQLKKLLDSKMLDFIALDYKATKDKFYAITHSKNFDAFSQSLDLILECDIEFEVRTTLHAELLDEEDINSIIDDLKKRGYAKTYFIQEFRDTGVNIGNITKSKIKFDKSLLSKELIVVFR